MNLEVTKYYKSTTHPDLQVRAVGEHDTISVMITMNGRYCSFVVRPNRIAKLSSTNWEECDKEHFEKLYNRALKAIEEERKKQI